MPNINFRYVIYRNGSTGFPIAGFHSIAIAMTCMAALNGDRTYYIFDFDTNKAITY